MRQHEYFLTDPSELDYGELRLSVPQELDPMKKIFTRTPLIDSTTRAA